MDANTLRDSGNSLINAIGNVLNVASSNAVKQTDAKSTKKGVSQLWVP